MNNINNNKNIKVYVMIVYLCAKNNQEYVYKHTSNVSTNTATAPNNATPSA